MKKPEMSMYLGVKAIMASEPITKKAYCDYREWDVPKDEDPNALVRLVEYQPDPKSIPNHKNHEGYVSMSPLHVFNDAYRSVDTEFDVSAFDGKSFEPHQERVVIEAKELGDKIVPLTKFISGDVYATLPDDEQVRLANQVKAMTYYFTILIERVNNF